jgi:SAM-dependent methyltransferase
MKNYILYKLLQNYVHRGYKQQKACLRREFAVHTAERPAELAHRRCSVLELACGDGDLATVFPANVYVGIDLMPDRILAARTRNPGYEFQVCDLTGGDVVGLMSAADFIFCHAALHHLDDEACRILLERVQKHAMKPTTVVAIEPVLPLVWRNPFGFMLCKLDEGRFVRTAGAWQSLFAGRCQRSEWLSFLPRWPIFGQVYVARYC